jgi:hypothetical protein
MEFRIKSQNFSVNSFLLNNINKNHSPQSIMMDVNLQIQKMYKFLKIVIMMKA